MLALQAVLSGVGMTVLITLLSFTVGAVLGVPLALARRSVLAPVRVATRFVIDVLRGIPPVVFLFVIYFGVGTDVIRLNALQAAVIGLGLIAAGYMAEIYRGGLLAVHKGQFESAAALGMNQWDSMTRIIGPQAIRVALPSATTYLIGLLKDSSIASTITATEMLYRATAVARGQGGGLEPFLIAAVVYIALGAPLAWLSRTLDAKMRARVAK